MTGLSKSPSDLRSAEDFWRFASHPSHDVRTVQLAIATFRVPAIHSNEGVAALVNALFELADQTGELPEKSDFDAALREAIVGYFRTAIKPINHDRMKWLNTFLNMTGKEKGTKGIE